MSKKKWQGIWISVAALFIATMGVGCQNTDIIESSISDEECVSCEINKANGSQFIYNGSNYTILNEKVEESELGKKVGKINSIALLDESYGVIVSGGLKDISAVQGDSSKVTYLVKYDNIYQFTGNEAAGALIILVNGALYKAVQTENMVGNEEVIQYTNGNHTDNVSSKGFSINTEDYTQIINGNITYQISDQKLSSSEVGEYLGVIGQSATFDAQTKQLVSNDELQKIEIVPKENANQQRCSWVYGQVHAINNEAQTAAIAVEINNKYMRAEAID